MVAATIASVTYVQVHYTLYTVYHVQCTVYCDSANLNLYMIHANSMVIVWSQVCQQIGKTCAPCQHHHEKCVAGQTRTTSSCWQQNLLYTTVKCDKCNELCIIILVFLVLYYCRINIRLR